MIVHVVVGLAGFAVGVLVSNVGVLLVVGLYLRRKRGRRGSGPVRAPAVVDEPTP